MEALYLLAVLSFLILWWIKLNKQKKRFSSKENPIQLPVTSSLRLHTNPKGNEDFQGINNESLLVSMIINHGEVIEKIYELSTDVLMPFLLEKSTGGKSINGHFGFKEERLVNEFKAKLVYQK